MLYQLPDGRTIELSLYDFLSATEEQLRDLNGADFSVEINNPSYGSSISKPTRSSSDDDIDYREEYIQDVPSEEKLEDQDYTQDDE